MAESRAPRRSRPRAPAAALLTAGALLAFSAALLGAASWGFAQFTQPRTPPSRRPQQTLRLATATATATEGCTVSGRQPGELAEEARELLQEMVEVTLSTGLETGLSRATVAARAAALTAADIARKPPSKLDDAFVARVLRQLFERLGATYIKLGQFVASSPTVFPPDYVREFQNCLDSSVTVPFSEVRKIIEDDLGQPVGKVFSYLDPVPLASASIAQVHAAKLRTGEEVVVKVQKPGIEDVLQTDLGFVYLAARVLGFINPDLNSRGSLSDIASDLRISMLGELDFRQELENLETFREFLVENGLDKVAVAPKPFASVSSRRVLTMERLHGVALTDLEGIKDYAADPEATLVAALNVWSLSVQRCEFFHADVHAGNLLVLKDGRVAFLDFGIVGRLPPEVSSAVDALNDALAVGDARGMARALISMGATVGKVDEDGFAKDIEKLLARLGNATDVAAAGASGAVDEAQIQDLVLDIAQVAGNNGLKLPREFGLLIKQALYFDRYTKLLAPELDMMSDSRIARLGGGEQQPEAVESGAAVLNASVAQAVDTGAAMLNSSTAQALGNETLASAGAGRQRARR